MKSAEGTDFNRYKDTYRDEVQRFISFSGQDLDFFTEMKVRYLLSSATRHVGPAEDLRCHDVGCGVGLTDTLLAPCVRELHGADVADDLIVKAAQINPTVHYKAYDGKRLPFQDCSFDIVFAICVMHHVPAAARGDFIRESARVVKQDGMVIIFEHNPFNPLTQFVVSHIPLDAGVELIRRKKMRGLMMENGLSVIDEKYIIFFPFRGRLFAKLENFLYRVPVGAQYYVAGKRTL
jgi:SAM-dependent methyltransferase